MDATRRYIGPPTRAKYRKSVVFCILEYKWMSDVCDRYLLRSKSTTEHYYVSFRSYISEVIHHQDSDYPSEPHYIFQVDIKIHQSQFQYVFQGLVHSIFLESIMLFSK